MSPEWRELLIDQAFGLIRYLIICPAGGFMLMKTIFQIVDCVTGKENYKKLSKSRKIKCWLLSSALVMAFGVICRAFSY